MRNGGGDLVVFSSLLIGLMAGVHPVQVDISPSVRFAAVRFVLDGEVAAEVKSSGRWSADIDFGSQLRPHELTALVLDSSGEEVARASRLVNLPQSAARVDILVDRNSKGSPVSARLVATSVMRDTPGKWSLSLDGVSLPIQRDGRAVLPELSPGQPHLLSGTAEFSADAVARTDIVLGSGLADEADSRLTAVPLRFKGSGPPSVASLQGRLLGPFGELRPVTIETGGATIVFVRHPSSVEAARQLGRPRLDYPLKFDPADRVGFVWPTTRKVTAGATQADLFESMPPFLGRDGGFFWLITRVSRPGAPVPPPYRFADAVAIAGMEAFGARTRRAVVLIEGDERRDASQFSASQVEGYLRSLGVPLHFWSLARGGGSSWSGSIREDISSFVGLSLAVSKLKRDLESQRIVWVKGEFRPGRIRISGPDSAALEEVR